MDVKFLIIRRIGSRIKELNQTLGIPVTINEKLP